MKRISAIDSKLAVTPTELKQARWVFEDALEHAPFMNETDWRLLAALHSFDSGTARHSVHTMFFASNQAEVSHELPDGSRIRFADLMERSGISFDCFRRGALHHDIGKIMLPKDVLFKRGKLNAAEQAIVATHENGSRIILDFLGLETEARVAGQHHNYSLMEMESRFYIPKLKLWAATADLLHLADAQEALLRNRVYRPGLTPLEALRIMVEQAKGGKIGRELTCLWVKEEMRKVNGSYLNRLESSAWREMQNLLVIKNFLSAEWKHMKMLCQQPPIDAVPPFFGEVFPCEDVLQAACWA